MLDTDTKRRIDSARDILVGKVPDPKSQVEQITIALIYKFMDDMDAEAEELGGKRKFFEGEYARYGWAKLMRSGLGGFETLNLYAEAIAKMPENPGIPPLFRDIFKNAYLPYRDPETLKSFLKIIDEFTYDHSEKLGDAFEYLLSVLGSQGEAGQFRTPRHIIDFIVSIVDPKKNETILDPACGTAGFLISAYKHIVRSNTDAKGNVTLTPDEKGRIAQNLKGYDISPDMVRLSLVNLYLHGFTDPHIVEYDTLTSEEKWNELADVILANPPFMSPKGGIKPHKRFSVQSKRSEVLFVDYMAEHLTPTGRAGIIVPEGVIFQSGGAYKELRKMLVENSLVAVISLPAGVFNPYSGVKTSILILDKSLAKQSDSIGFFKIENDGFGLGAQRRALDTSDLHPCKKEISKFLHSLRNREDDGTMSFDHGVVILKSRIAEDADCNLNSERFRTSVSVSSSYPLVPLSSVAQIRNGFAFKSEEYVAHGLRVIRIKNVQRGEVIDDDPKFISSDRALEFADFQLRSGDILMSLTGNVGRVGRLKREHEPAVLNQRVAQVQLIDPLLCMPEYTFAVLNTDKFILNAAAASSGVAQANLSSNWVSSYQIPLPPLEVQKEIVAEIEGYQKVIDGARAIVENYRPRIVIDPEWPLAPIGEISTRIQYGLSNPLNTENVGYKTFRMNELVNGLCVDRGDMKCSDIGETEFEKYQLLSGDILFNRTNSIEHVGRTGIFNLSGDYCFASYLIRLSVNHAKSNPFYVNAFMNTEGFQKGIKQYASRAIGQANINAKSLAAYSIPLPPLGLQDAIVEEIEAEQSLVAANKELIERFEKKIQAAIARVWGEDTANTK
jgi:type I restriction enzyme M protein